MELREQGEARRKVAVGKAEGMERIIALGFAMKSEGGGMGGRGRESGFCHGLVAKRGGVWDSVFDTLEGKDIAKKEDVPVAETRYIEPNIKAVLVVEASGLGIGMGKGIVKPRGVVAGEKKKAKALA